MEVVYVRGSQISFIVLPKMFQRAPFFNRIKLWRKYKGHAVVGANTQVERRNPITPRGPPRRDNNNFAPYGPPGSAPMNPSPYGPGGSSYGPPRGGLGYSQGSSSSYGNPPQQRW